LTNIIIYCKVGTNKITKIVKQKRAKIVKTIITIFVTIIISQIIGHFYISTVAKGSGPAHKKTKIKYRLLSLIVWPVMLVVILSYLKKFTSTVLYSLLSYIIGVVIIALIWTPIASGFFWKLMLFQGFVTVVLIVACFVIIYLIVNFARVLKYLSRKKITKL
jgi:hypothetical protein